MRPLIFSLKMIFVCLCFLCLIMPSGASGLPEAEADKTGSPYFFVSSEDAELDVLPLKSTDVDVRIAGVIADVAVTQVYQNQGKKPLEAVYVFPASTRAAVYAMTMRIGERKIVAKIDTRKAAQEAYEAAKNAGQSASLLEQQRPNVFEMNVANILPGDVIRVELQYTELLIPDEAVYEFTYPTVVGPRYTGPQGDFATQAENWTANPYLHEEEPPTSGLTINVHIAAGLPIDRVSCDTHKTNISFCGKTEADIHLDEAEKFGGNRDFILRYCLAGGNIESGLLLYEGEKENFFLLMMQPPKTIKPSAIPPREYIFIVDVSGSMHGFPIDVTKALLRDLIGGLTSQDRFNVLLFSGGSSVMSKASLPATPDNIRRAIALIEQQQGGGGTQLLPALKEALAMTGTEEYARTLVIATDGYVSVEKQAFELIRTSLGEANLFAFGIGSSVNRYLIEGMARAGMGEPFIVTEPEEASSQAEKFKKLLKYPVLTDIRIDYDGFETYDVEPRTVPDLFANRPVIVFGKWRGKPEGDIYLQGVTGEAPYKAAIPVKHVKPEDSHSALRYLCARHRIALIDDDNRLSPDDEGVKEVTRLGLEYNLLTAYTSFIAVDSEKRLSGDKAATVKQPLPLPQGVSDYAVGQAGLAKTAVWSQAASPARAYNESLKAESTLVSTEVDAAKEHKQSVLQDLVAPKEAPKEQVQKALEAHHLQIEDCLVAHSKSLSAPDNRLIITLTIDKEGQLTQAEFDENPVKPEKELIRCLTKIFEKIKFPQAQANASYEIRIVYSLPAGSR